jgi:hypothetical protein
MEHTESSDDPYHNSMSLLIDELANMSSPSKSGSSYQAQDSVVISVLSLLSSTNILASCLKRLLENPKNVRQLDFFTEVELKGLDDDQRKTLGDAIAISLFDDRGVYEYKGAVPPTSLHNAKKHRYFCPNNGTLKKTQGVREVFLFL